MPVIIAGVVIVGEFMASSDEPLGASTAFASPKSSTLTLPSFVSAMFAGFRSRWMIPSRGRPRGPRRFA
jgi:hypothetical protein